MAQSFNPTMLNRTHDVSVVICAYTEDRWDELCAAVASVQRQSVLPREIILVVDHNPSLYQRVCRELRDVIVVENSGRSGLSDSRNSGVAAARGTILAFLDDDATAAPDWLERLTSAYDDPAVLGVGGAIEPSWMGGRPAWFPREFDWVVGCTYRGMPRTTAPVRNLIGCNMSLRYEVFEQVGGFRSGIGRTGTRPLGCEETELCIRVAQHWPRRRLVYEPGAVVWHRVPAGRACWRYFRARCYNEGLSKARVARSVGQADALSSERLYVTRVLPLGVARALYQTVPGRESAGDPVAGNPVAGGLGQAAAISVGLAMTMLGYIVGRISNRWTPARENMVEVTA